MKRILCLKNTSWDVPKNYAFCIQILQA